MRGRSCSFLRLFILLHPPLVTLFYIVLHLSHPYKLHQLIAQQANRIQSGGTCFAGKHLVCANFVGDSKVTPTAPPKFLEAAFTEFPHGCDGQRQLKNIEIQKTRGWCLVLTKIGPKQCRDMSLSENRVSPILMLYHLFPIKHCNCARVPMFGHPNMSYNIYIFIFICILCIYIYICTHYGILLVMQFYHHDISIVSPIDL